jgi:thiamine-monophosphate kinase
MSGSGEFDLIARYFTRPARRSPLGVGDDCALLAPAAGMQLAVPAIDEAWLDGFSRGLFALADAHGCELVGGDTTRGPLNLCITVFGEVPAGAALLRSGARAGDDVWVSGTVGDARLALEVFRGTLSLPAEAFERARGRMEQPTPRVALGLTLRGIATAAVDISDGLVGDLGHVLRASGVGARLDADAAAGLLAIGDTAGLDLATRRACALAGGDDYELAFTAPASARAAVEQAGRVSATPVTRIGAIEAEAGLRLVDAQGAAVTQRFASFDHFA